MLPSRYVRCGRRPASSSTAVDLAQLEREAGWSGQILGSAGWRFNQALGEMRGVFGIHIGRLAVAYGLDVDEAAGVGAAARPGCRRGRLAARSLASARLTARGPDRREQPIPCGIARPALP